MKEKVLIAGGSGLIGELIQAELEKSNYSVRILTRNLKKCDNKVFFYWNPMRKEIDLSAVEGVTTIINLSGASVVDKRWSKQRKNELIDSRVYPAVFLAELVQQIPDLVHYISASGINCYPLDNNQKVYTEEDDYGTDFLSEVVEQWEMAADGFKPHCKVTKLRISTVLSSKGGALQKMEKPFKNYIGSPIGNGKQMMSWVHEHDLVQAFIHIMQNKLEGTYNLTAEQVTNREFSKVLAKKLNKPMIPVGVPEFILNIVLGEMAEILTNGVKIDATKIKKTGFDFKFPTIDIALNSIYNKK